MSFEGSAGEMPAAGRLAVVGVGVMGGALARGLVRSGELNAADLILFDSMRDKAEALAAELDSKPTVASSEAEAVTAADTVLVATKPKIVPAVLQKMWAAVKPTHVIVSIAAGVKIAKIESLIPERIPVLRVMPNTPATIGEAATAIARGTHATDAHVALGLKLFRAIGKAVEVDETLMDAVTGLSGSGPAYVFLIVEALTDGAVKIGLPRETARLLAAQTVYGAAKMVLETGAHPAQLKDNVTTPGGTTIAGLAALEHGGLRAALMDAVEAAATRSKEMG
jgi:pyrroline-5-carboxylate reductase